MKKALLAILFTVAASPMLAAQHSATLAWNQSITIGVSGYNVYRAPCSGTITNGACSVTPSAFAKIAAVGNVGSYQDTAVSAGGQYVYQVTAVCPAAGCAAGIAGESDPSNPWAGAIPTDRPNAASGLTGSVQ